MTLKVAQLFAKLNPNAAEERHRERISAQLDAILQAVKDGKDIHVTSDEPPRRSTNVDIQPWPKP